MPLKRNIIANYVGQGWSAVMGLAFIPLYIQYLGMEAYGLIGLFAVMQAWLTMLDMGMTPTLNREMARFTAGAHSPQSINDLLRSLEIIAIGIGAIICILVWLVSDYLANQWLKADKLPVSVIAQAISIMGVVVALRFVESIYRGSLLGLQQQVWYNIVNAAIATLRHGGVVMVLALISPSIQIFFLWQIAVSIVAVGVLAHGVHSELPRPPLAPRFKFAAILEVWKFAGGVMAVTLLAILLTQIDKVLLSRLLTLEAFGFYTLAATVAGVLYVVTGPVINAFYPRMVELLTQEDESALASLYHQAGQLITVLIAPAVMLLCVFSEKVIFVWSGDPNLVENTAPILSVFVIGVFLNCLMHMPAQLQLASGWVSLSIKTNLVAVIVLIPAIFWVVPRYGVIGAAWIWVTLNAGYILVAIQLMHRRLIPNEKWKWYFADVLIPAIGVAGIVLLAEQFQPANYQNRWKDLVFLLIVGTLALLIAALLANRVKARLWAVFKSKAADA
ncbi:MAG: oligosaccharide flippase family protein [Nitrosomonadales bacterium]|nr:oligosaccharide flippase family protein [Nitrosomonadales bacterium]